MDFQNLNVGGDNAESFFTLKGEEMLQACSAIKQKGLNIYAGGGDEHVCRFSQNALKHGLKNTLLLFQQYLRQYRGMERADHTETMLKRVLQVLLVSNVS